ncbi:MULTISPECIES: hypothetical protein [Streptomyces]|uniref:Uncharacterized protein n=1 Tax=Streptomyces fradiae TaxID=1906 RepID=A0ACC4W2F5_STRFR|nr:MULTISPECIES: hypothetical protein [Streptomyces]KNE78692.1 hypothetical protein ADZ36_31780 [Streptomyces fradiae]
MQFLVPLHHGRQVDDPQHFRAEEDPGQQGEQRPAQWQAVDESGAGGHGQGQDTGDRQQKVQHAHPASRS